jgi:CO dehydrogenase nickel-insertion accessory protein CooC1
MNMKKHDTGPPVRGQIVSSYNGQPVDLTNSTITFIMYRFSDDGTRVAVVDTDATIELPETEGFVRYDWSAGDTETIGNHQALFQVVYEGGVVKESYPNKGYIEIRIEDDLNDA